MLPNLHSLSLHRVSLAEDLLFKTIKRISESRDTEALSRLIEVRLLPAYDSAIEELVWVRTFARLPSVKSVEAWYIGFDCESTYHNYPDDSCGRDCYGSDGIEEDYHCSHSLCHERRLALPPRSSAITHLTFIKCSIETRRLVSFLEGMRALESFEYLCTNTISKPEKLVDALLAHAKHTLRKLRLRSDGQTMGHAITLADFEVMNELDIGYELLQRHLVHFLPPSIEKVRLSRLDKEWHYFPLEDDVRKMTAGKAEHLPNIKELTIELLRIDEDCELLWYDEDSELLPYDELNAATITTMKHKCEEVGVRLSATFEPPVPRDWID